MIVGQGKMKENEVGAKRESNEGRGRFDLFPYEAMEALAKWYEDGASKYGDRNWEKGVSVKDCINRMIRHSLKAGSGWTDEDHLSAVMWNAAAAITMMQRHPELNDHVWHGLEAKEDTLYADGVAINTETHDEIFGIDVSSVKIYTRESSSYKGYIPVFNPHEGITNDMIEYMEHLRKIDKRTNKQISEITGAPEDLVHFLFNDINAKKDEIEQDKFNKQMKCNIHQEIYKDYLLGFRTRKEICKFWNITKSELNDIVKSMNSKSKISDEDKLFLTKAIESGGIDDLNILQDWVNRRINK